MRCRDVLDEIPDGDARRRVICGRILRHVAVWKLDQRAVQVLHHHVSDGVLDVGVEPEFLRQLPHLALVRVVDPRRAQLGLDCAVAGAQRQRLAAHAVSRLEEKILQSCLLDVQRRL